MTVEDKSMDAKKGVYFWEITDTNMGTMNQ